MKTSFLLHRILAAGISLLSVSSTQAVWFDVNGTTPGFGVTDGSTYNWLGNATDTPVGPYWTSSSLGTATPATWASGGDGYFIGAGAGTNYTVRLGATGATGVTIRNLAINTDATGVFAGAAGDVTIGNVNDTGTLTINASDSVGALAGGTLTVNNPININGKTLNFRGGNVTFAGVVSGTGALTIDNSFGTFGLSSGTLVLTNTNNYTATTNVNYGVLDIGGGGAMGSISSSSPLTLSGLGTLALTRSDSATQTFGNTTLNPGAPVLTAVAGATIDLATLTRNVGGTLNLNTPGTIKTKTANTNGILGGWATVAGTDWAVSAGNGTVSGAITALSSYTNDTWAAGNNTTVTVDSTLAADSTTNSLRFNNAGAATLTLSGNNTITSGGVLITANVGSNPSTITGGRLMGASGKDLIVFQNNTGGNLTINSVIGNNTTSTGLTKAGAGTLVITANNTYTGGTYVTGGNLVISGTSLTSGTVSVLQGATLEMTKSGVYAFTTANATTVNGGGTIRFKGASGWANTTAFTIAMTAGSLIDIQSGSFNGGAGSNKVYTNNQASLNVAGNATFATSNVGVRMDALTGSGTIDASSSNSGGSFTFGVANGSGMFGGNLTTAGNNKFGFTKLGTGTQTLSGTNTYNSTMTVSAGVLALSGSGKLGGVSANLTMNGGQMDLGGLSPSAINLVSVTAPAASGDTIKNGNLTATSYAVSNTTGNAIISANLLANGSAGFAKSGAGIATLAGNNTFAGATTVTAGTLVVSGGGTINSSANVTVSTGASLTNDTVEAITPALFLGEGSTLSGTGSFTPAAMTLTADLANGFTPITAGGTLTKAGSLTFTLTGVTDGSYSLFTGSPASSFASVNVGGTPLTFDSGDSLWKGAVGGFDYAYSDVANTLSVAAIPEPGTWILVGIGLAFLLYRKPRRRLEP